MAILKKVGGTITKLFKKGEKQPVDVEQPVQVVNNDGCDKCKCKDKCQEEETPEPERQEVPEEKDSENDE